VTSVGGSAMVFSSSAMSFSNGTTPFQQQAEPHLALAHGREKALL